MTNIAAMTSDSDQASSHEDNVDPGCPQNLLAELDAKQNQVMKDLDELNGQIESLLRQCSDHRSAEKPEINSKAA